MLHDKCPLKTYKPKDLPFGPQITTVCRSMWQTVKIKNLQDVPQP